MIVIASGGGGVPVILNEKGEFEGFEGVVDKDLAGEKLAEAVAADYFMVLTDVPKVKLGFGTPEEREIDRLNVERGQEISSGRTFPGGLHGPQGSGLYPFHRVWRRGGHHYLPGSGLVGSGKSGGNAFRPLRGLTMKYLHIIEAQQFNKKALQEILEAADHIKERTERQLPLDLLKRKNPGQSFLREFHADQSFL